MKTYLDSTEKEQLIKELERVNQKLLRAEQIKSDFLSNIKNEINNPLTSMLGLLKDIMSNPDDQESNIFNTRLVFHEVHNLNFQMRNIFAAAELEAGEAIPEYSNVSVQHLMDELKDSFSHLYDKKDIELIHQHTGYDLFVTDRDKLHLVLTNLLSNAIKFSSNHSAIQIETGFDDESNMIIRFQDEGVGIREDDLNMIFDRFKQLDSGTTKAFGGHGLGLAVTHSLIDLLDGDMEIDSIPGEGTVFTIKLPAGACMIEGFQFTGEDDTILIDGDDNAEIF